MRSVHDKPAEPPGVSRIKTIQDEHTGLSHLDCYLTPYFFKLVSNTIIDEMSRQNRLHDRKGSTPAFIPTSLRTEMDSQSGLVHCECDLDLHYLRLVFDALDDASHDTAPDKFDVFISYAHEDSKYVAQLVQDLRRLGITVWIDADQIHWGDEHREKIDHGIRNSKYSIVVCSNHYFAQYKSWTKTELNAAYQAESIREHQILPLWHHITEDQLYNYSSMLASRDHMDTSVSTLEIAVKLLSLLHPVRLDAA